jgi:hypothetical protein
MLWMEKSHDFPNTRRAKVSETPEVEELRIAIQGIVDAQLAMDSASRSAHNGPNTWRLCEETRVAYLAAKLKLNDAIANLARQHPQQDRAPQGEAQDFLERGEQIWRRLDPLIEDSVGVAMASKWIAEAMQFIREAK